MANTDTEGFNSLDPLGPEYGRINQPLLDNKGLSAFEGDTLHDNKINFPEQSFFPTVPNLQSLEQPQGNVRQTLIRRPLQKPVPNKKASFQEIQNALRADFSAHVQSNQDKSSYGKVYSYDAGPDSNTFFKRYQAYGQETFDKIGFSPLRDNEALYNSRTSMLDDSVRMMKHSFLPLATSGFVSAPKSLFKMLKGDFTGTDLEDAELYKESAAIGQSSKGGAGGFVNNLVMNFAYTAGIMTEALAEEAIGALLAPETLGGSLFVTTANNVAKIGKIGRAIDKTMDGYKAVNTTLKTVDSVAGARKFWENAKTFNTTLNPLQNTFQAFKASGDVIKKGDQLYNFTNLARAYKTAGGFYKDVRNVNMALAEARLEAGMVENQVYDNLYNKHYRETGEAPDNDTQYEMVKQSKKASFDTLKWNAALIYGSNAITFPNIVGPKGGISGFLKNSIKEAAEIGGGKFGKIGSVVYDQAKKEFAFKKNNFANMIKNWGKQPIYKSALGTIGYFKSNFTEGIQESLQEVISGANEKYYSDTFMSPALKAHLYAKGVDRYNYKSQNEYLKEEVGRQLSSQGLETFASGFFMGTLAAPLNAAIPNLSIGYNRIFNKEGFQDYKRTKARIANDLVNNLNAIDINEFLKSRSYNYGVQDLVSRIKQTGTTKEAADATDEAFSKQMTTLLEDNAMNLFREKINHLKELTPEEFEDSVPNVPKGEGSKFQAKLDGIIEKTKKYEQRYNYFAEKFPNPITEENLPPKDSPEYEDAIALYHGWKQSVDNAIFFDQTFDHIMERKRDVLEKFISKKPLKSMSQKDSEVLFDFSKLTNEVALLRDEVKSLEESKQEGVTNAVLDKQLRDKQTRLAALEDLAEKTSKFKNFFNRYDKAAEVKKKIEEEKGAPATDEEVDAVLDRFFGEFSDDNKTKYLEDYKESYVKYLKAVAGVNDDYLFDRNIDESFELIADYEKLGSEANQIMKYVNLLHDPAAFLESAKKNRDWMKKLYAKRKDIYKKVVEDQLDIIENNALLNALANEGIYISMEDFAEWKENGTPPKEFFDNSRKIIIPEGTEQYEKYYSFFEQAAELKEQKSSIVPESLDKQLQNKLDALDEQMAAEIANVPKKNVRQDKDIIYPIQGDTMTASYLSKNMEPGDYAEAFAPGVETPFVFYKDEQDQLNLVSIADDYKDPVDPKTIAIDFEKAQLYIMNEVPDPELVKPIEERYEALKNEAKQQYANELLNAEKEEATESFEPITADTELEEIEKHPALYNELYKLFFDKYISNLSTEEDIELSEDPVKMRNAFTKFLQTDPQAKKIINEFNNNMKLEEVTKETGEKEDFEFMYQGKKFNTADIKTVYDLRKMQRRFKNLIAAIEKIKEPTAEDITNKSNYMVIVNDLEKLIATRSKKEFSPELQEAIKKIQELKDKQGEIVQTPAGYVIDGEVFRRVTNVIQELKGEKYEYTNKNEVNLSFYNTIGDELLTDSNIDNFIADLRRQSLSGFSEFTYNELSNELKALKDQNVSGEKLLDRIQKTVSEKTYEESRISGNYVDNQIKNIFDGQAVEFNPDLITEEAFDNLFGPTGLVTMLKQRADNGEIYIVSQGIRVFDKELKIAGEIDLLVADTKGNITIVDVKTGEKSKWDNFKKKNNKNSKMEDYQLQQTAYANLLDRMIGYNPKIALLPVEMKREKETGKILTAGKPTSPTLLSTDFLIFLDKAPVQERIDSIIPRPETKPEVIITPSQIVPEDAESSDDVTSPAQEAREVTPEQEEGFISDDIRYDIDEFKKDLAAANTIQDLNLLKLDLSIKINEGRVAVDDLSEMARLFKEKSDSIKTGESKIDPANIQPGTQLVAKTAIFEESKTGARTPMIATEGSTFIVNSVDTKNKTVSVSAFSLTSKLDVPFDKLNEMFILKDTVMDSVKEEVTTTKEDKDLLNQSTDLVDNLIKDTAKLAALEETASKKSVDDLDDELLNDLKC